MTFRPSIVIGVTADQSIRLIRGLPEFLELQGWDVHVVGSPGPHLDSLARDTGAKTYGIKMAREPRPFVDLQALFAWVVLLRRIRPTVLFVGTPKAGLLGTVAGFITRVPRRVYILRGLRLETESGVRRGMLTALERITAATAHQVLCVSESLARRYVDLGLTRESKTVVLGRGSSNGVDVAAHSRDALPDEVIEEARQRASLVPEQPVIGFVGRLTRDKGLGVLADAATKLRQRGVPFQVLLVGSLDEGQNASTLGRLRDSQVNLSIVGHVEDTRPYFHLMEVLCLPTFREGFPNVVLEAAAAGVPSVTTNATGAIDSVVDGITGLVTPVGSADHLARALQALILDPQLCRRLGEAAHARATQDFDRSVVWNNLNDFLTGNG